MPESPPTIESLVERLEHGDARERGAACRALAELGPGTGRAADVLLVHVKEDEDQDVRCQAAITLLTIDVVAPEAVGTIVDTLPLRTGCEGELLASLKARLGECGPTLLTLLPARSAAVRVKLYPLLLMHPATADGAASLAERDFVEAESGSDDPEGLRSRVADLLAVARPRTPRVDRAVLRCFRVAARRAAQSPDLGGGRWAHPLWALGLSRRELHVRAVRAFVGAGALEDCARSTDAVLGWLDVFRSFGDVARAELVRSTGGFARFWSGEERRRGAAILLREL